MKQSEFESLTEEQKEVVRNIPNEMRDLVYNLEYYDAEKKRINSSFRSFIKKQRQSMRDCRATLTPENTIYIDAQDSVYKGIEEGLFGEDDSLLFDVSVSGLVVPSDETPATKEYSVKAKFYMGGSALEIVFQLEFDGDGSVVSSYVEALELNGDRLCWLMKCAFPACTSEWGSVCNSFECWVAETFRGRQANLRKPSEYGNEYVKFVESIVA
tara:strand:+ start:441 stop:1079 length:639 start_codon:yes stop_codon:yes gene_type:complete